MHDTWTCKACGWSGTKPATTEFTTVVTDWATGAPRKERVAGCVCPDCGSGVRRDSNRECIDFRRLAYRRVVGEQS